MTRRYQPQVTSAKEILAREVERLSESDAREVLDLIKTRKGAAIVREKRELTREELLNRAAGREGIGLPDPAAPPFEKIVPIQTRGIPASKLLISDRR